MGRIFSQSGSQPDNASGTLGQNSDTWLFCTGRRITLPHNAAMSALTLPSFPAAAQQGLSLRERWGVRLLSLLVWLLAAGALAFWLLGSRGQGSGVNALVADTALHADEQALARLLGYSDAPPPADTAVASDGGSGRFVLQGAVANAFDTGIAVIAVDGQPGRPFRVGQEVADGWTLEAVGRRSARLQAKGGRAMELSFAAAGTGANLAGGVPPHGSSATPVQPVTPQGQLAPQPLQTLPSAQGGSLAGRFSRNAGQANVTVQAAVGEGASATVQTTPSQGNIGATGDDDQPRRRDD